jgi:hypothetical protein
MDIPIQVINGTKLTIQASSSVNDIVNQILLTILGASLGLLSAIIGYLIFKKADEKDVKRKTIDSLIEELEQIKKVTNTPELGIYFSGGTEMTMNIPYTLPSAYESVVNSGSFSQLSPQLQTQVSGVYVWVNQSNVIANQLYKKYYERPISNENKSMIGELNGDFKHVCQMMIKEINELLPVLDSEKIKLPKKRKLLSLQS